MLLELLHMSDQNTLRNTVLGAIVTLLLSFTTVSPVLGGALAGYLEGESPGRGMKVGAISGALASIPFILVLGFGVILFFGIPGAGFGVPGGLELAIIVLFMLPLLFAWTIGLSAVGGYLGGLLGESSQPATGDAAPPEQEA